MAAVLCGEGSSAFVGGVGTCSQLFRGSIKAGKLWLLVVLTGAEHNEVGSVCEGTPWLAQASQRPGGKRGGEKDKAAGAGAKQGHSGWTCQRQPCSLGMWARRGNGAGASRSWQWGLCSPAVFAELMDPISTALEEKVARGQLVHTGTCVEWFRVIKTLFYIYIFF